MNERLVRLSRAGTEICSLDDWATHAAPKGKDAHWEDGKSAKELARAWCQQGAPRPPDEFMALLRGHPLFASVTLDEGFPEHRTSFDHYPGEPRNADLNLI